MFWILLFLLSCLQNLDVNGQIYQEEGCGIVPNKTKNENPLDNFNYPWLAALGTARSPFKLECSGVLITKRYVLTSRVRIVSRRSDNDPIQHVRLGDYDLDSEFDYVNPTDYFIDQVIEPDEEFQTRTYVNDTAIVKLDRDVIYTDYIRPICLPIGLTQKDIHKKKLPVISYGHYIKAIDTSLSVPYEDTAVVIGMKKCEDQFEETDVIINDGMFCAGVGNLNSCYGEIGAPVQYKDPKSGRWTVVGTLTVTYTCDDNEGVSDVNLINSIIYYQDFIKESIGYNSTLG